MSRLLITANSPGEMAGWVKPILSAWREQTADPVDILLLPCTFATGQEERVARSLVGVDRVYRPSDYFKLLWSGGKDYSDGHLLHLGGDLMYSAFLSWRWGISAWSYLWARPWWNSAFEGYFTKDEWGVDWLKKRKVPDHQIHLTGDLVLDAVRQEVEEPGPQREAQISYLPGSRREELATLTPFFLGVHKRLQGFQPATQGVLHVSPFIPREQIDRLLQKPPHPKVGGLQGRLEGDRLVGDGVELLISREQNLAHLSRSELALSIPGTKTAEAGYLRTPLVTLLPLNRPEELPSIGLVGLLDYLPGGKKLKGRLLLRLKDKLGLLAHPNIIAGRQLLPELVEVMEEKWLSQQVGPILQDKKKLREVSDTLRSLYSWQPQPARTLVEVMLSS